MARMRYGMRRWVANFSQHNGTKDAAGLPDYSDPANWVSVLGDWPCELITTRGGETIRGRQVTAQTTHVAFGDWAAAASLSPDMRCEIAGQLYSVVGVLDSDGLSNEMRVELRREF